MFHRMKDRGWGRYSCSDRWLGPWSSADDRPQCQGHYPYKPCLPGEWCNPIENLKNDITVHNKI